MENYFYNNIIDEISSAFEEHLARIEAVYNFEYGVEFEINICRFLRNFLPSKYGICRGFVVDKSGNKAGDDIIIYDQENYPTLRILGQHDTYELKEQIPVEAVYAYIEATHTLTDETLKKAMIQVAEVKKMCYSRNLVYIQDVEENETIFNNKYSRKNFFDPVIRNPVYGMILSANCSIFKNSTNKTADIVKVIKSIGKDVISNYGYYNVDSIVADKSTIAFCADNDVRKKDNEKKVMRITKFYTGILERSIYHISTYENRAYGFALCHLMDALKLIQLDAMPWGDILNTASIPDCKEREKAFNLFRSKSTDK